MAEKNNAMPSNLEAEQSLLGCILIDNIMQSEIIDKVNPDDFYMESHRIIVESMLKVLNSHKPIDMVTLSDQLELDGELDNVGGITYLAELGKVTPSAANYKYYLDIVKRDSTNRKLIRAGREIINFCSNSGDEENNIANAEKLIYDIAIKSDSSSLEDMREGKYYDTVLKRFEQLTTDKDALKGVKTGFSRLDQITNGLQKSDLIVLAARPGVGKTTFAMNIVANAAIIENKTCAVFSLEMPRVQIAQRLLCSCAKVSMESALAGKLDQDSWRKLWKASADIKKAKIFIDDSSLINPSQILSKCRRLKSSKDGLDLIMIDYIQLMTAEAKKNQDNRQQEIASITRNLKIIAKELDVPVIALSQLRRISNNVQPQLSDLRESGAIEQDADIVMFIHRPDSSITDKELEEMKMRRNEAQIIIAKHRNGAQGKVRLKFVGEESRFVTPTDEELVEYTADDGFVPEEINDYDVYNEALESMCPPEE